MAVTPEDFEYVCGLVRAKSGIVLEAGKEYMVDARLGPLVRQEKLDSIAALVARLRAIPTDLLQSLRNALDDGQIPTPVTLFVPTSAVDEFVASKQVKIVGCRTLEDALLATWSDLR